MPLLLDTHAFLWWCEDSPKLSRKARRAIQEEDCLVSLGSFWEISIKVSLGKLKLPSAVDRYLSEQMQANGFSPLEIAFRHIARCSDLPFHHRDPFDRLMIAQAIEEDLRLVSIDKIVERYGVRRVW